MAYRSNATERRQPNDFYLCMTVANHQQIWKTPHRPLENVPVPDACGLSLARYLCPPTADSA